MASAIMCASSYMCNVHRWNTPDLQLRKVRVIKCQSRIERFPCIQFLCHYSPRRWTARVETTSTLSSCMHPGRSCAGSMYCKCCTMQLRHQCINAPWPLLCRFNIILKWSQVLYNAVQSCEVMADEVQIPKPWSLACFCFCQHANVNLSSNLHPPKQQLLHSPRFEFLAKYLNIEK